MHDSIFFFFFKNKIHNPIFEEVRKKKNYKTFLVEKKKNFLLVYSAYTQIFQELNFQTELKFD